MPFSLFKRSKSSKGSEGSKSSKKASIPDPSEAASRAGESSRSAQYNPPASSDYKETAQYNLPASSDYKVTAQYNNPAVSPEYKEKAQYSPPAYPEYQEAAVAADDPYAFLSDFDTIFLIDDSGSMQGERWSQTKAAMGAIVPICTAHDADGIDIYFLNKKDSSDFHNVTSLDGVNKIFSHVSPSGMTPTGRRLNHIIDPYLNKLEGRGGAGGLSLSSKKKEDLKPLNIIVITDGAPTDASEVESTIVSAAKRLDALEAPAWQIGVQFFQIGEDTYATRALTELDDSLKETHHIRDMVDTVPWKAKCSFDGAFILKVVTGAVNRRLDRRVV